MSLWSVFNSFGFVQSMKELYQKENNDPKRLSFESRSLQSKVGSTLVVRGMQIVLNFLTRRLKDITDHRYFWNIIIICRSIQTAYYQANEMFMVVLNEGTYYRRWRNRWRTITQFLYIHEGDRTIQGAVLIKQSALDVAFLRCLIYRASPNQEQAKHDTRGEIS